MGFWLFGGRKNRKDDNPDKHGPGGAATHEKMAHRNSSKGADVQRRNQEKPKRLTKVDRSMGRGPPTATQPRSFTAPQPTNRSDFPSTKLRDKSDTFPTPPTNPFISPTEHFSNDVYQQNPASQSSIGQDLFSVGQRPPTLNAKRTSHDAGMPRRKTSKRRAEERQREKEIKQMTKRSSMPAGLLRQDTKKIRGGLNRHLERPTSEVSLPIPESLSDSLDDMPEHQHSFKVKSFDILAPRPTIRYTDNPRYRPSRSQTTSRTSEKRPTIPEEDFKSRRRIEDLADGMDASGLRELMERDRRRKEKKQVDDQKKLERRLQRRAERQRQQEEKDAAAGPSTTLKSATTQSEPQRAPNGLGIASADVERSQAEQKQNVEQRAQLQTPESWLHDPSKENVANEDPFADSEAIPKQEQNQPSIALENPRIRSGSPADVRMSQASIVTGSPPRSPVQKPKDRSSMSQMSGLQREYTPDIPEHRQATISRRRQSDQSGGRDSSWSSFFRRGTSRNKRRSSDRGRPPVSDFSNTSRDSFPRQAPPPAMPNRTFRRSSTPIRVQSKFKEDLPDFPPSPPDSRVASPEAVAVPSNRSSDALGSSGTKDGHAVHHDVISTGSPKPGRSAIMSQSLASVDSEASWLSGRPAKRASLGMSHPLKQSETSLQQKEHGHGDEDDLANDEYLNRLSPAPESRRQSAIAARRASSTILGHPGESDDDSGMGGIVPGIPGSYLDEPGTKLHGGVGKRPTLVDHQNRTKSREGVLNDFDVESGDEFDDDDIVIAEEQHVKKTHLRHVSGGSARLLDVRPPSLELSKRLSAGEHPPSQRASIHSPDS